MASSYTTSLKIQEIGDGEQAGTWGSTTNTNWTLIEQAVAGVQSIVMSNADYTLSNLNGVSDEARNAVLVVTGTNSAVHQIIAPLVPKVYLVSNQTTGGYAITIGGPTGGIVSVPNGYSILVYCDGVNFANGLQNLAGNQTISGGLTVNSYTILNSTLAVTGAATFSSTIGSGAITSSGAVTATQFNGSGAGLTGTAASLTVSGSNVSGAVASATNATNATQITNSGGWNVTPSGTTLYFSYNGTNVGSLDSSGNLTVIGNVTAFGTV